MRDQLWEDIGTFTLIILGSTVIMIAFLGFVWVMGRVLL